ncbi:MAG: putative dolichyl-phosphate-mannose--protein mannosyltransferase [Chroococcopsis gigantea SAG 12.99]|jgi:dolichyl-phosphate-mannose-protein mannosyltransferase|nr:phospholipid carrier-dependent glycosyltransferase [Chlorogloea purpurea SAG 13.99]MDV2999648.1 putative dolichyl-phosphate-mannose--protein mannosyltransferase [Chroococcopsis gigantea SAG 12.99]
MNKVSKFQWGLLTVFLFSMGLRFWNLSQFNELVFDEIYYAVYSNDYLIGKQFFQSHPPLTQYLIAFGIWVGSHFPTSPDTVNNLTGTLRSTVSYRWLNAFCGSFIPLIVGGIAYELTFRRSYALIAAFLISLDGLFLVESRYALNNIYLIIFGLLGQLCFLTALRRDNKLLWFLTSGMSFGACVNIKWNGLGFLLGLFLLLGLAFLGKIVNRNNSRYNIDNFLYHKLTSIKWYYLLLSLIIVPIVFYSLLWIPHLYLVPQYNFWEVHREIFSFHQRIKGNTSDVHPYCSPWYSWLIMWRPIAYYYKAVGEGNLKIIYDVHAMGNPILWWLSTTAIITIIITSTLSLSGRKFFLSRTDIAFYLICNYVANLLPWLKITRCTFLYHYMPSYIFSILGLAWIIDYGLQSPYRYHKILSKASLLLIVVAFIYWLPVYIGIPLSAGGFYRRLFLPSWI